MIRFRQVDDGEDRIYFGGSLVALLCVGSFIMGAVIFSGAAMDEFDDDWLDDALNDVSRDFEMLPQGIRESFESLEQ